MFLYWRVIEKGVNLPAEVVIPVFSVLASKKTSGEKMT
jgi:hypothetical protein